MKILIDSREQLPLTFSHPLITASITTKLEYGDYGVRFEDNFSPKITFERKSIPDLFSTLTHGHKRFNNEIRRSQADGGKLFVIVEGSLTDVFKGHGHTVVSGTTIVYQIFTNWCRYDIQTIFTNSRREMTEYIVQTFIAAGKKYLRDKISTHPAA